MPPRKRAADAAAAPTDHAEAGSSRSARPSTNDRPRNTPKRIKAEPSSIPDAPIPPEAPVVPDVSAEAGDEAGPDPVPIPRAQASKPALISSLALNGIDIRPMQELNHNQDHVLVTEVLLFPSELTFLRARSDALFSVNCTPQVRPAVPPRITRSIYHSHFKVTPLPPDETPRYIHIGRTNALGFPLHLYALLARNPTSSAEFGPDPHAIPGGPYREYQKWFDQSVVPTLRTGIAAKYGLHWGAWHDYERSWSIVSRGDKSKKSIPTEQSLPVAGVHDLWHRLVEVDSNAHLRNAVLFAYADLHTNAAGTKWTDFASDWAKHVNREYLKSGSKVTTGIELSVAA